MIYLASPYTHKDKHIEEERYRLVLEATARLLNLGVSAYSPIACWHVAAKLNELSPGYATFQSHDEEMISLCERFNILTLPGWRESKGVAQETRFALIDGKFIEHISLDDLRHGAYKPTLKPMEE